MTSKSRTRPRPATAQPSAPSTGARAAARVIDIAVIAVPFALIAALRGGVTLGFFAMALLAIYVYETMMVANTGATLGKQRMGLRIVDAETGGRPMHSRAGRRILIVVGTAAVLHLILPIGPAAAVFLWGSASVAADGRGLPDRVAGTRVETV